MKRLLLILALAIAAFCFVALPAHAQAPIPQNVIPHDSQPIQPVIVSTDPTGTCTNYAQTYINWKTGVQTVCASGNYVSASGSGGMVYPSAGIPLSAGTAWSSSIAAPSGALVGTTDTQTLTNKTVDGASPTAIGYISGLTSDAQTQLNSKISSVGVQQGGSAVGTAQILNFGSNLTATVAGNVATISASGGGTSLPYCQLNTPVSNSQTLSVGTDCSVSTPYIPRVGSLVLSKITAAMTATTSTGTGTNDTAYIYIDTANGNVPTIGDSGTVTLTTPGSGAGSGMVVAGSPVTSFPVNSIPLFTATITSLNFSAVTDYRASQVGSKRFIAGTNVSLTETADTLTINSTGGSTFNGGTITTPLTISTDGLSGHTPLLNQTMSNSGGYNTIQMSDDLSHAWQIGVGGSATSLNQMYFWDATHSNTFLKFDPTSDLALFTSLDTNGLAGQFNGSNQYSASIDINNTYSGSNPHTTLGITTGGSFELGVKPNGAGFNYPLHIDANGVMAITSGGGISWSNNNQNSSNGTIDTTLTRLSAGVVGVKDASGNPATINAGTFSASGVSGFSGTKVIGSCTITFAGGIVTNVTGC